jgi:hypothetical protein
MKKIHLILAFLAAFAMPVHAQDADISLVPYRKGDLWGFANSDRQIVIKAEYEEVDFFYVGYAIAKKAGKYGYINKAGKVMIPFKFFSAKPFRYGYFEKAGGSNTPPGSEANQKTVLFAGASLQASGYEICINTKGEKMPKCPAISESSVPDINKPSTVTVVSSYSTMQKSELYDKIIGDYKMPGAEDSYYIATRNNNYGVFNKTFEVIVPFEYSKIEKINMGAMPYLVVEKNGLKGITFGNGSIYMAVENTRLEYVQASDGNNYIIFTKDGKTGMKNTKYAVVIEPLYSDISYNENGGFVLTGIDKMQGFYFLNTNILPAKYVEVKKMKGAGFVKVKTHAGKWGYINNNLVEFFEE